MRVQNIHEPIGGLLREIPRPVHLSLAHSCHWQPFFQLFEEMIIKVSASHPLKAKLIAGARIETGTIDATPLANLLRLDHFPSTHVAPRHVQDLREIPRHRAELIDRIILMGAIFAAVGIGSHVVVHSHIGIWQVLVPAGGLVLALMCLVLADRVVRRGESGLGGYSVLVALSVA